MKQGASSESINNKEDCTPSRPNRSLVRIDSIFINIDAVEQSKPEKCGHFTIRGYVSDTRKQNGKLDGDDTGSAEINSRVPPLHTPKFKSWRCESCLKEIDAARALEGDNINVNSSRQWKTKNSRSHRSLENVVAYLSEKLNQPPELGRTKCEGTKSAYEFTRKQILDSALYSNTRGLGENELRSAANGFILNQRDSLAYVDEHQKQSPRPSRITTSTKSGIVYGAQHKRRHTVGTKLVHIHQQQDDSISTGRRKTKTKKVRLLNEILDKDGKGAQPAMTEGFHIDESVKVSCSASQSLQQVQFNNLRCRAGQKRNKRCQGHDSTRSQMHNGDSLDVNGARKKAQDTKSAFANAEMHKRSKEGRSDESMKQSDKMLFGSEQRADGHKSYHDRCQRTNNDSFSRQEHVSTCKPFHGTLTVSLHNSSLTPSQFKGKSKDTINKVNQGANVLAPADNGKEPEGNSVPPELMETMQIGQLTQSFQPMQNEFSSKRHYLFSNGCLDARKGTRCWLPGMKNGNLRNEIAMQYMGESSSVCKSSIDKNIYPRANSNSGFKRPNQGPYSGTKKPKHRARTEGGPAVVHQTEFSLRDSNKKMGGTPENPEITLSEFRSNMMQEAGASDDIPMEIVELMAKNQYERHLHEVGDNHYVSQSGYNPKNDLVGSTSMLPNVVSRAAGHEKPHFPSARLISEINSGISNKNPNSYVMQRPSTGSTCSPFLSSQRELSSVLQFPDSGSSKTDIFQNCKYDMNKSASELRVSPRSQALYEAWQPAPRQSDKRACAWPMAPPNNPVYMPSVLQGNALQPFNVGKVRNCSSYVMEVRDFTNLGLAEFGNKTDNFKAETSHASRPNRADSRPQVMGSPDPYANDAIPAMHLLSLMNGHTQSSTPKNMDVIANRKTFDRSFSNDHLAKELSENNSGVGKSCHKFKQPSLYSYHSKNLLSDASCQCSPPVPILGSVVGSLHGDVGNKRGIQPSSQHLERAFLNGNAGSSLLPIENKGFNYQKSRLTSTGGLAFQELIPAHELANHIFSPSWSGSGSSHLYMNGDFSKKRNSVAPASYETLNRRPEPGVCLLNRNPMEFTTPGPGNEYMIGAEDLKLRKTYPPNITRPMATNSFQQLRFTKYTTPNNRL